MPPHICSFSPFQGKKAEAAAGGGGKTGQVQKFV